MTTKVPGDMMDSTASTTSSTSSANVGKVPQLDANGKLPSALIDTGTAANDIVALDGTAKLPAVDGSQLTNIDGLTLGTPVASTSGATIDFTGIPAGTKRITINLVGVSTTGTSVPGVQIGDAGGIETSGYTAAGVSVASIAAQTTIFPLSQNNSAGAIYHGSYTLNLENSTAFTWVWSGNSIRSDGPYEVHAAGSKSLSAELTQIRLTTVGGSETFDAGEVNISYES